MMTDFYLYLLLLFIHAAISIGVGYWLYCQFSMNLKQAQIWKWLGIIFCFFLPFYGLVGILFLYFTILRKTRTQSVTVSASPSADHLRRETIQNSSLEGSMVDIDWQDERIVQPLVDALKGEDVEIRKGAIDALAAKKDPEAIKALADSLENTALEVRYFAVEALGKISKDFSDRIIEAQTAVEQNPGIYRYVVELGTCYYEYGVSAVEDKTLSEFYLRQAFNEYGKAFELNQTDMGLLIGYAEVLTRLDEFEKAFEIYQLAANGEKDKIDAMVGMADVCFKMGNLKEVKKIAKQLKTSTENMPEQVQQAVSTWI